MLVARLEALNASLNAHAFLGVRSDFNDAQFVHKITGNCSYAEVYDPFPYTIASTADFSNTRLQFSEREYICVSGTIAVKAFFTHDTPIYDAKLVGRVDRPGEILFRSNGPRLTFITQEAYANLPRKITRTCTRPDNPSVEETIVISTTTNFLHTTYSNGTDSYSVCLSSPADVLAFFYDKSTSKITTTVRVANDAHEIQFYPQSDGGK
jgi:hypothetical protein